ncbi:MAG: hypothetical protein P0Y53_13325 [Candidatus Pseudobacter hemicellulosilyticus]|uniref:Uncharacterized protein n=1 Tax=Candidatus Pseudobacter hemicellulosilyticus TaxID=3121375 RepID=A0AAJ5WMN4_9BACT|nr:MAG: hypothetical protein P0Y53_13325 [Pseudobacter sp.]
MALTSVIGLISSYSSLLIPVLFWYRRHQRLNWETRLLLVYAFFVFGTDRLRDLIDPAVLPGIFSFVFTVTEYGLLALLLFLLLSRKRNRKWVVAGSLLFAAMAVLAFIHSESIPFSSLHGIEAILLISYIFLYLLEWIMTETFEPIDGRPEFWMVTGCLLYLAGNFFYYIAIEEQGIHGMLVHYLVNMLRNACFITAIIQTYQKEQVKDEVRLEGSGNPVRPL